MLPPARSRPILTAVIKDAPLSAWPGDVVRESGAHLELGRVGVVLKNGVANDGAIVHDVAWADGSFSPACRQSALRVVLGRDMVTKATDEELAKVLGVHGQGWQPALHPREWHGHFARIAAADHHELARAATATELRRAESYARKTGHHEAATKLARARMHQDKHPSKVDTRHPLRPSVAGIRPTGTGKKALHEASAHIALHMRPAHVTESSVDAMISIMGGGKDIRGRHGIPAHMPAVAR